MPSRIPRRVLGAMLETRWAITPEQLDVMIAIANRDGFSAVAQQLSNYRETEEGVGLETRNDGRTAIIRVVGPSFRYANVFTMLCGGATYEDIALQLQASADDPRVENAIFLEDTPGGMVTGCAETVGMIESFPKPIVSYVDGDACSAGYWMGAACDHIVVSRTSQVGCLGVVAVYTDNRKQLEMDGLREYELVSTLTPNKRPDVTTTEGRAELMRSIDATAEIFLDDVSRLRGISGGSKGVSKRTNGGAIFVGQHAVDIGLADEVGSFEDVVDSLSMKSHATRK